MYFIRTDIRNQTYPGKEELTKQIMDKAVTHYEDIDPRLFISWSPSQLFDTKPKYSPWLFVLRNDASFEIDSNGSISVTVLPESTGSKNSEKQNSNREIQIRKTPSANEIPKSKLVMKALFKRMSVENMKGSKIDQLLKPFSSREYFSQLLWDVAIYIQQDLGLAIHCHDSAKIEAYKYFLTGSFVKSIFKV